MALAFITTLAVLAVFAAFALLVYAVDLAHQTPYERYRNRCRARDAKRHKRNRRA